MDVESLLRVRSIHVGNGTEKTGIQTRSFQGCVPIRSGRDGVLSIPLRGTMIACKEFHLCTAKYHGLAHGVFDMKTIFSGCVLGRASSYRRLINLYNFGTIHHIALLLDAHLTLEQKYLPCDNVLQFRILVSIFGETSQLRKIITHSTSGEI